ncbi:MAG TPA: polyprenyl diphosphate synthase [Candidatus Limnocylindria bacterium]|nr:polyprenyl diphosphate synthase [Candidatus Limnocylindria bacterium]
MPRTLLEPFKSPERSGHSALHVAIVLDGSGRWAEARGWSRDAGHRAGVETVRHVVAAAPGLGIGTLTLFAFSVHNWQRPRAEVEDLFELLREYLFGEVDGWLARGVRASVLGRRDRLPQGLRAAIATAEAATAPAPTSPTPASLHLRLAIDYSSREEVLRAAQRLGGAPDLSPEAFTQLLGAGAPDAEPARDVDLMIRTGGEQRLSDFMLWEIAHAELWFTPILWPDFTAADLEAALAEFRSRERPFGGLRRAV